MNNNKKLLSKRWQTMPVNMRETIVSYAFLFPAISFFAIFVVYPMLSGIYTSFFNYTMSKFDFIGVDNYIRLFSDDVFIKSMKNTIILVLGVVPIVVIFSVFASVMIYQKSSVTRSFFRCVFYLPVVTGAVSVTVVWKWIFDPLSGILNWLLQEIGMIDKPIMWLGDKRYAIWAILLVLFTTSIGQPIILYVAALGNIDESYIEASQIDGANSWQIFRHIKWPSMMPTSVDRKSVV